MYSIFQLWMVFQIRWEFSTRVLISHSIRWIRNCAQLLYCSPLVFVYWKKLTFAIEKYAYYSSSYLPSFVRSLTQMHFFLSLFLFRLFSTLSKRCANFLASQERKISILHLIALFGWLHSFGLCMRSCSTFTIEPFEWCGKVNIRDENQNTNRAILSNALWHSNWILVNWIILSECSGYVRSRLDLLSSGSVGMHLHTHTYTQYLCTRMANKKKNR